MAFQPFSFREFVDAYMASSGRTLESRRLAADTAFKSAELGQSQQRLDLAKQQEAFSEADQTVARELQRQRQEAEIAFRAADEARSQMKFDAEWPLVMDRIQTARMEEGLFKQGLLKKTMIEDLHNNGEAGMSGSKRVQGPVPAPAAEKANAAIDESADFTRSKPGYSEESEDLPGADATGLFSNGKVLRLGGAGSKNKMSRSSAPASTPIAVPGTVQELMGPPANAARFQSDSRDEDTSKPMNRPPPKVRSWAE